MTTLQSSVAGVRWPNATARAAVAPLSYNVPSRLHALVNQAEYSRRLGLSVESRLLFLLLLGGMLPTT